MPVIEAFPLTWPAGWTRTERSLRLTSRYEVSLNQARTGVVHTLKLMGVRAHDVVVSSDLILKRDGTFYANPDEPDDPGVAVYWTRKGEQRVMACDHWRKIRDNMRAIGLALDGLRAIERAGASQILDRAFAGFAALPAPVRRSWKDVFGFGPNDELSHEVIKSRYKRLVILKHPDAGGTHEALVELNRAFEDAQHEY